MSISCGIFIVDSNGYLLIGNPTGNNPKKPHWSIPKGEPDINEEKIETALREAFEESKIKLEQKDLTYVGESFYKSKKKTLFAYFTQLPSKGQDYNPVCESLFTNHEGKRLPEIGQFLWVPITEARKMLHEAQVRLLDKVLKLIK